MAAEAATLRAAAALSMAAALIHASVIVSHFQEYWLFGAFFVVSAVGQFAWAGLVWVDRASRRLLIAGALGNLAIALLWLYSRTAGLPIGPDAGERAAVGLHDVFATAAELGLAAVVAWALLASRRAPGWLVAGAWALAAAAGVSAFLGSHTAG